MTVSPLPRRVLIASSPEGGAEFARLFAGGPVFGWEALHAASYDQASFVMQHEPCDVVLLEERLYRSESPAAFAWLAGSRDVPVVYLAGDLPELAADLLALGAASWLPRAAALSHPRLLTATLGQAARIADLRRRLRAAGDAHDASRRQVTRLVSLLWEAEPAGTSPWLSQRGVLERLDAEVARAERHGVPFAVALGEVRRTDGGAADQPDGTGLAAWTAEKVARLKRRSDVAGRYGPHGFLILLIQTPEEKAQRGCERLQQALEGEAAVPHPLRVDFGVAGFTAALPSPKALLSQAERRLDVARAASRGQIVCR